MLAVATGYTLEYIDSLPMRDFNGFLALNCLDPFTHDVKSERDGLLITETFNSRRKKQITSEDLFPYLKRGTPHWLDEPNIRKAKELMHRHEVGCKARKVPPTYDFVKTKIIEQLNIEKSKPKIDSYMIQELEKLLKVIYDNTNIKTVSST